MLPAQGVGGRAGTLRLLAAARTLRTEGWVSNTRRIWRSYRKRESAIRLRTVGSKNSKHYHSERRAPFARARMLLLVNGKDRDWLEGRGQQPTLIGAVVGATGEIVWAHFREQEDSAGYLQLLSDTVRRREVSL